MNKKLKQLYYAFTHVEGSKLRGGFTLAETLIAIGIIGVVAALTIPSLISKYEERQNIIKLKRVYSVLSQAYKYATEEYGTPEGWELGPINKAQSNINMANKFVPYLKLSANCVGMTSAQVTKYCGVTSPNIVLRAYARLFDGTLIRFRVLSSDCTQGKELKSCGNISVSFSDINPIGGKNSFSFHLTQNGIVPNGDPTDTVFPMSVACDYNNIDSWGETIQSRSISQGSGCTAWAIKNENMDYMRCKLDWTSNKKSCD